MKVYHFFFIVLLYLENIFYLTLQPKIVGGKKEIKVLMYIQTIGKLLLINDKRI